MPFSLQGHVAIVTGNSTGLGKAIGLALGWMMLVTSLAHRARHGDIADRLSDWVVNQPATQAAFAIVAIAASGVLVLRRDTEVNWRMP